MCYDCAIPGALSGGKRLAERGTFKTEKSHFKFVAVNVLREVLMMDEFKILWEGGTT